jgi:hypothetical protein
MNGVELSCGSIIQVEPAESSTGSTKGMATQAEVERTVDPAPPDQSPDKSSVETPDDLDDFFASL